MRQSYEQWVDSVARRVAGGLCGHHVIGSVVVGWPNRGQHGRNATWSAGPVPTGNIGIQVAPPRRADCALLQQRRTTPSFLNHPCTSVRLTPSTLFPVCRSSVQWRSRAIS